MWKRIWDFICRIFSGSPRRATEFAGVVFVESGVDPAPHIRKRRLVLVGSQERAKWLRFLCPCGCGQIMALNLMRSHSPHWDVTDHGDGTVSVTPSVHATKCGSHYWLRRNRVDWV